MSESPPPMRSVSSRHAISVLIVTAGILWNLVALTRAAALKDHGALLPSMEIGIWMGVAHAQVMLAAGYVAWGQWNVAVRAGLFSLVLVASSVFASAFPGFFNARLHLTIFLCIALGIATPLSCIRVLGLHLADAESAPSMQRPGQFTIWQILSLMAAVAILLTLSRWAVVPGGASKWWSVFATWLVPQSAIGLTCLILPFVFKRWWWSACITAVGSLVLGLWYLDLSDNLLQLLFAMTQWFLVVGCCGVLRLAGYRLAWRSSPTSNQPTSSSPPHTTAHPGT